MHSIVNAALFRAITAWLFATYLSASAKATSIERGSLEWALGPAWCQLEDDLAWAHPDTVQDATLRNQLKLMWNQGCAGNHHYCAAIYSLNKAFFSEDKTAIEPFIGSAKGDFSYVINQSKSTCPLVYDGHVKFGEALLLIDQYSEAEKEFLKALRNNPQKSAAYIGLSNLYELQGYSEKAAAILAEGLRNNPKSASLRKKLDRLKGRKGDESSEH